MPFLTKRKQNLTISDTTGGGAETSKMSLKHVIEHKLTTHFTKQAFYPDMGDRMTLALL